MLWSYFNNFVNIVNIWQENCFKIALHSFIICPSGILHSRMRDIFLSLYISKEVTNRFVPNVNKFLCHLCKNKRANKMRMIHTSCVRETSCRTVKHYRYIHIRNQFDNYLCLFKISSFFISMLYVQTWLCTCFIAELSFFPYKTHIRIS